MIGCDEAREALALQATSDDREVREHLEQCQACASYRRRSAALDQVLRAELRYEVPLALSIQLLALAAPQGAMFAPQMGPKRWYVTVVYLLTAAAIGVSTAVAWQFYELLASQIGLSGALAQLMAAPGQGLAQLTLVLPESRYAIDFFLKARDQLLWLLLALLLWAALDGWTPQVGPQRQTSS